MSEQNCSLETDSEANRQRIQKMEGQANKQRRCWLWRFFAAVATSQEA
jgi:hypothetical protein